MATKISELGSADQKALLTKMMGAMYAVSHYGTDDAALQAAIDAAEANGRGAVYIDDDVSMTDAVTVEGSNILLYFAPGASLKAHSTFDPGTLNNFMLTLGDGSTAYENIAVEGYGIIDGDNVVNGSAIVSSQTAQTGTINTITLHAGASAVDGFYKNDHVDIESGTGSGQTGTIIDYNGTTKVATIYGNWTTIPDNTSVFSIYEAQVRGLNATGPLVNTRLKNFKITRTHSDSGMKVIGQRHINREEVGSTATGQDEIDLGSTASATDDFYKGMIVGLRAGTGAGQWNWIVSYNGTTKTAKLMSNWMVKPVDNGAGDPATTVFTVFDPMRNTLIDDVTLDTVDEGCNFHRQYGSKWVNSTFKNARAQDLLEPIECVKTLIGYCSFENPGKSNACIDLFNSNWDLEIGHITAFQETDYGTSNPSKFMTMGTSAGFPEARANLRFHHIDISGNFNMGFFFGGNNGLEETYHNVTVEDINAHDMTGADPAVIEIHDASVALIRGLTTRRIKETGGSRGRAIRIALSAPDYVPPKIEQIDCEDSGTAHLDINSAPTGGETLEIDGYRFHDTGSFGLRAIWDHVGTPVELSNGKITGTYSSENIKVTGTGNIKFRKGNDKGNVIAENSGSASVADGGTIAHGLSLTPTQIRVHGTVAGEIVTATSADGTNITVAVKQADGSTAGTPQTVYWEAIATEDAGSSL